jgi:A/G-specific adenine glycosylase
VSSIYLSSHPSFTDSLIAWQLTAGRHDLPWQKTRDPYRIWLSEIMLQQTQVGTVIPYYQRFLDSFPDVASLAAAAGEQVIAHWAGLGYYARARNLHRCAQQIMALHGGRFPATAEVLVTLPGIGRSTAAAIAAFAFGERAAILDGNVKRVLCRHFGIEGFPGLSVVDRELWQLAGQLLPETGIEAYTQGLMDLGATVCTRSRPRCSACPLSASCVARRDGRQAQLPTARPVRQVPERQTTFVLITDGTHLLLERRPDSGIWGGLLVPPEGEMETVIGPYGLRLKSVRTLPGLKHSFTHFHLHITPVLCHVEAPVQCSEAGTASWLTLDQAVEAGVPTPIRKLLRQLPDYL